MITPTPRQLEVLRAMAVGQRQPEIARALGIPVQTVKNRASAAYQRIGAVNGMHALAILDDVCPGWRTRGEPPAITRDEVAAQLRVLASVLDEPRGAE